MNPGQDFVLRFHQGDDQTIVEDGWYIDDLSITAVPEPGTAALLGLGLAALGVVGRKQRKAVIPRS